ncbi:MAG TPA: DHHA1 domain-containing protein [Thermoanaerobaculia bacterium]|nr:DHHA1 domain-containing protein [Thermoanaerobaculia bacterium]HUM29567.1 DHHA1 domain-containing protein [Thermoanaerobaculia bacterium]HXK67950.1 DHHA1 domain-containing protein [Thermoanaerobaculia bacterium]
MKRVIDNGHRFLVTTHLHPDGDAVGTSLALQQILTELGKEARVIHRETVPFSLRRLPRLDLWNITDTLPPDFPDGWDAVFVIECPKLERTGFEGLDLGTIINIDHHISNIRYGAVNVVDPDIPCVGMLIWDLAVQTYGLTLRPPVTDHLYVALSTDTGQFCYANAGPEAFSMASDLVRSGTRPDRIATILYEGFPASATKLKGLILSTLEISFGGRVAMIRFPRKFLAEAGAEEGDAEGVIDEPRKIDGVEVAVLLREQADGSIKVSMRSQGTIDVESIAREYGGGGHHNAAGFVLSRTLEESGTFVLQRLEEVLTHEN